MAIQQEPDAEIHLGYLTDKKLNSQEKIKSMCDEMYDLETIALSDNIKHYLKLGHSKEVWLLKYGKNAEVGIRTDKDNLRYDY